MDTKHPKIALFGNFGTGNLGNDCTLEAMLYNLRKYAPEAEITCVCSCPEDVASRYDISAVPIRAPFPYRKLLNAWRGRNRATKDYGRSISEIRAESHRDPPHGILLKLKASFRSFVYPMLEPYRWLKAIKSLKGSQMLVMTGTGMLGDFGIRPFTLHYDILSWSIIARLCGCKLLFVSVGAGPIRHPLSRYFVKRALVLAAYRSYRDNFSKDYLESIGLDTGNDKVYPDLAFSLPQTRLAAGCDRDGQRLVVGLGLMNYYNRLGRSASSDTTYREYISKIATLAIRLLERKFTVRLLIGDLVYDNPVREDLKKSLEERGLAFQNGKIIDEPARSVDDLLLQLSSTDMVIASRFHNVLLGLMLKKPVVAISYHEKFEPLMAGLRASAFCQDIEKLNVDYLMTKLTSIKENVQCVSHEIDAQLEAYRAALDEQYRHIFRVDGQRAEKHESTRSLHSYPSV